MKRVFKRRFIFKIRVQKKSVIIFINDIIIEWTPSIFLFIFLHTLIFFFFYNGSNKI